MKKQIAGILMGVALCFVLVSSKASEALNFIKPNDLKAGIYLSFEEFKNNHPSIDKDSLMKIIGNLDDRLMDIFFQEKRFKEATFEDFQNNEVVKSYVIKQIFKSSDSIMIWGCNDGNNVFYFYKKKFYTISFIGRYSILECPKVISTKYKSGRMQIDEKDNSVNYLPHKASDISSVKVGSILSVLDFETGEISTLDELFLLTILSNEADIKEKYLKAREKKKKYKNEELEAEDSDIDLTTFIIAYNLRHPITLTNNLKAILPVQQNVKW